MVTHCVINFERYLWQRVFAKVSTNYNGAIVTFFRVERHISRVKAKILKIEHLNVATLFVWVHFHYDCECCYNILLTIMLFELSLTMLHF